jgi:uncharacterized membrane protein
MEVRQRTYDTGQGTRLDLPHYQGSPYSIGTYRTDYYGSNKEDTHWPATLLKVAGGLALAVAGGALAFRGVKNLGKSMKKNAIDAQAVMTVNRSPEEVYRFWRQLNNLPRFMRHLAEVQEMDNLHSHWVAKVPGNLAHIEWDAEIMDEEPGRFIAWRSLPNADIENSGEVRFEEAPGGLGTIVHAIITYKLPAGTVGNSVGSLLNPGFEKVVRDDLRSFKELIEGEAEAMMAEGMPPARKRTNRAK